MHLGIDSGSLMVSELRARSKTLVQNLPFIHLAWDVLIVKAAAYE